MKEPETYTICCSRLMKEPETSQYVAAGDEMCRESQALCTPQAGRKSRDKRRNRERGERDGGRGERRRDGEREKRERERERERGRCLSWMRRCGPGRHEAFRGNENCGFLQSRHPRNVSEKHYSAATGMVWLSRFVAGLSRSCCTVRGPALTEYADSLTVMCTWLSNGSFELQAT